MAAIDFLWDTHMSSTSKTGAADNNSPSQTNGDVNSPTFAAFSPATLGHYPTIDKQRSTILVHQKSPLLVATPPQITRALAYSYPFLLPINKLAGLVTWTTGDPWESFLLVAAFWALTLYGDVVTRWGGPVIVVLGFIAGMYARRFSSLSSTGWTGEKQKGHKRGDSETSGMRHHKSLDEIVDSLRLFTSRCNILLDPFLRLTEFLSTQQTATSATTRPALTVLFIRILFVTPVWIILTLPPLRLITTKRVVLALGTVILSWHSRPARISRTILWRSRTVRNICAVITGLDFGTPPPRDATDIPPPLPPRQKSTQEIAASLALKRGNIDAPGIRFTFTLYENQRRWLGIGWTSSMLAYERAPWTDEHLNAAPSRDQFELPDVEGGFAKWRWAPGSKWKVDRADDEGDDEGKSSGDRSPTDSDPSGGWIYYDNKWRDGRRDVDGWGRYTRRRKWYRDAELIEVTPTEDITPSPTPRPGDKATPRAPTVPVPDTQEEEAHNDLTTIRTNETDTSSNNARKRRWFRSGSRAASERSGAAESTSSASIRSDENDDIQTPLHTQEIESGWGFGDNARMELG